MRIVISGILGILFVCAMFYMGYRSFVESTSRIRVEQVEPNVRCAKATTINSVALSCWRTDD